MATEPISETTSRCRICQEPIHPNAKRCNACGSYQDWRRYFDFSAVVLSLLVALISVISAVGPRIISFLPPLGSRLEIKSYYYSTDGISLIAENKGNQPGHIGRVNLVLYCTGAYFHQSQLDIDQRNAEPANRPPVWGVDIDLGTSPRTSRTIAARSSREVSFILSRDTLRTAEEGFPKVGRYPAGDFRTVLYNESVRARITAELWDYGRTKPKIIIVTGNSDPPFWRGFTTITQNP
jgi:hypothetical protein